MITEKRSGATVQVLSLAVEFIRGFGRAIHHLALAIGASAIATAVWSLRDQIVQGLVHFVALVTAIASATWSALLWLSPYLRSFALWLYDAAAILLGALGSAIRALAVWVTGALVALGPILFPSPPPPPDPPTQKEHPSPPPPPRHLTIRETLVDGAGFRSERVKFAVFPADCVWPSKRADAPVCGGQANRSADPFAAALKEAAAEFGNGLAPRMVAFGLASCDGESLASNEQLAEQRARRLAELLRGADLGPKGIIRVSLGQFRATNCNRDDDKGLALQRQIVAAGIYGDLRSDQQLIELLKAALAKHDPGLPQPRNYSQFKLIP